MGRKKTDRPAKLKIYVTGYYTDKLGRRRYGFVKRDARKNQTIWIKDLKTREKYKIPILSKKQFKELKKNVHRYIEKGHKTFKGKKIEKVTRAIKEIEFPTTKPFEIKFDKGKYKRIETVQRYDDIDSLQDAFYSAFSYGKKIQAKIVVPSITLRILFKSKRFGRKDSYFFIWARRIFIDIRSETIRELFQEIVDNIVHEIDNILSEYSAYIMKIEFEMKLHWLIEN